MLEPDDITHQRAKNQLARELNDAVEQGLQINGIREPIYDLNEAGERVVVGYESLAWMPVSQIEPRTARAQRLKNLDDDDFVLTENGLEFRL
ncbi:hypothetical protein ACFO0J_02235 [Castellaniella hirudinis]|uniref:Uncharacterized protein n=1 Tax=Castellaniella hirudinis TaxID=1144617 RepID=A0ABV8RU63_9BURK